jgi:hypothetical protein|tara:strand:- start:262 stop:450 length:189 start_codon:yes stop_codon:yes gene_type:complete
MTSITIENQYGHCSVSTPDDDMTIDEMIALFEQSLSGIGYHWSGNIELVQDYDITIGPTAQN